MKQKFIFLASLFVLRVQFSAAQIVTENVSFDNYISPTNNDFTNRFTNGLGLTQITTNGITGGCLTTPNTVNWGNDNAIYCSKYIASTSNYANTGITFKYDSTQINSVNFDRAVSIFLRPSVDFNHYVIASVNYNKRLQIVTYSWANSSPLLNLLHDHWYQFLLNTNFVTGSPVYQINISAQVNDLGVTGLTPPIPVGNSSGIIYDSLLFGDSAVQVSLTGTLWGGAKYLENFHFEGIKSADSCLSIPTSIAEDETYSDVYVSLSSETNQLAIGSWQLAIKSIEVFDVRGQRVFRQQPGANSQRHFSIDVSNFYFGIYFVRIADDKSFITRKVVVQH